MLLELQPGGGSLVEAAPALISTLDTFVTCFYQVFP